MFGNNSEAAKFSVSIKVSVSSNVPYQHTYKPSFGIRKHNFSHNETERMYKLNIA